MTGRRDLLFELLVESPADFLWLAPDQRRALREHARRCGRCRWLLERTGGTLRRFLDGTESDAAAPSPDEVERVVAAVLRRTPGPTARAPGPGGRVLAFFRRRRPSAAAALLAAVLGALAGGAVAIVMVRPRVTFGEVSGLDTAGFWTAMGYPLDRLGVPGTAPVLGRRSYRTASGASGLLFAVATEGLEGIRLCAFDERRQPAWESGEAWGDAARGAPARGMRFVAMKRMWFPAPGAGSDATEERILLVATRGRDCMLTLLAPSTGNRDWTYRYPGLLGGEGPTWPALQVLPTSVDGQRAVVAGGQRAEGLSAVPVLIVVGPDGRSRQEIDLPVVRPGEQVDVRVTGVTVAHQAKPGWVMAETHQGLQVEFPLGDAGILVPGASLGTTDSFFSTIRARIGGGAYDAWMSAAGGEAGVLRDLASRVRELPPEEFRGRSE